MSFGKHLRQLRRDSGLSQRSLAERSGVDISYVSKLENERVPHTPSTRTLAAMAAALGTDEFELLARAGKLPGGLAGFVDQPQALQVMRTASDRIRTPKGWDALLRFVESDEFERQLTALTEPTSQSKEAM